jgi:hypothetical protein
MTIAAARWLSKVSAPFAFSAIAIASVLAACSQLTPATPNVCGNGAVEDGEDCDGASMLGTCGAAGTPNACHFVCDATRTCPDGYACGIDGRCREPGGEFAAVASTYPLLVSSLRLADFDGDGYADLGGIAGGQLVVRYGNAAGELATVQSQPVPDQTGPVAYGDLDGDGLQDAVFPTGVGLATFLGTRDRLLSPFPYSSLPIVDSTGALTAQPVERDATFILETPLLLEFDALFIDSLGHDVHDAVHYIDDGNVWVTCLDGASGSAASSGSSTALYVGPGAGSATDCPASSVTLEDLLDQQIVTGKLGLFLTCTGADANVTCGSSTYLTSAGDPTDEAVFAVPNKSYVEVLSMSSVMTGSAVYSGADSSTSAFRFAQKISLAASSYLNGSGNPVTAATTVATDGVVAIADVDGDGYNDLIIPSTSSAAGTVFSIAYNLKTVGLQPSAGAATPNAFRTTTGAGQPLPVGKPRLWTDLNGDGKADLVTDEQIFFTACTSPTATCSEGSSSIRSPWAGSAVAATTRQWTDVVAVDINHDGITDIAGFVAGEPDVDVMLGAGVIFFDRFTVATDAPVKALVAGDFDGDLVSDLAIVTAPTDASGNETDALEVSFGAAAAGPSAAVTMGTFGTILGVGSANIAFIVNDLDAATDLVVMNQRADGTRGGALLLGNSSRQLLASYLAPDQIEARVSSFDTAPGTDVATIGNDGTLNLYAGTGDGDLTVGASATFASLGEGCAPPDADSGNGGIACPPGTLSGEVDPANGDATPTGACIPATACGSAVRGACSGTIARSCTTPKPACPAGTFASEQNGCWDGYCLTELQCLTGLPTTSIAVGPLDPSGVSSLIELHSLVPADTSHLTASELAGIPPATGSGANGCAVTDLTVLTPPQGSSSTWTVDGPKSLASHGCQRMIGSLLRDLDGDGYNDYVMALCPSFASCTFGGNYILWGGASGFDTSAPTPVMPSEPALSCTRFSSLQLDADPEMELLGTCEDATGALTVRMFDLEVASRTYTEMAWFPIPFGGTAVIGEVNGDGLIDFLVQSSDATGALTQVYLQCAAGDASCGAIEETAP